MNAEQLSNLFKGFSLTRFEDGKILETLAAIHPDGRAYETTEGAFDGMNFVKGRVWKKSTKTFAGLKALGFEFIGNYTEPKVPVSHIMAMARARQNKQFAWGKLA